LVTIDSAARITLDRLAFAALALFAGGTLYAAPAEPVASAVPLAYQAGYERVRLAEGESTGLASGKVLFELMPDWWVGPALFGAMTGQRRSASRRRAVSAPSPRAAVRHRPAARGRVVVVVAFSGHGN
jgi:hypothetical protein